MAKAARGDQGGEKPQAGKCSPPLCPRPGTKPSDRFSAEYCARAMAWAGAGCPEPGTDQHASSPEAHHAQAALEREAVVVGGRDARLERLGAADAVSFLGLPLRVVHPLHVFP